MAPKSRIATLSGTFLSPGVSKNGRRYTVENIADAVSRANAAIADGGLPLTMMTGHPVPGQPEDVTHTAGAVREVWQLPDGSAQFTADIADTAKGRDIAALTSGKYLSSISVRGAWVGDVRKEVGEDGIEVETADGIELAGIDFTRSPGVGSARISGVQLFESTDVSLQLREIAPDKSVTLILETPVDADATGPVDTLTCPSCGTVITGTQPKRTTKNGESMSQESAPQTGDTTAPVSASLTEDSIKAVVTAAVTEAVKAVLAEQKTEPIVETPAVAEKSISEQVAEAIAAALPALKESIRAEIIAEAREGIKNPARKGVVTEAQSAVAKPLHEMSMDELTNQLVDATKDFGFSGYRPQG